jgi:hypothetical protein
MKIYVMFKLQAYRLLLGIVRVGTSQIWYKDITDQLRNPDFTTWSNKKQMFKSDTEDAVYNNQYLETIRQWYYDNPESIGYHIATKDL